MQPAKNPQNTQEKYWGFLSDVGGFHYDFSAFSRVSVVQDFEARKIVFLASTAKSTYPNWPALFARQNTKVSPIFERAENYCCLSNSE